ncbi:MAG: tetratricopeptide repeat protein [Anaerolineae bacterium]|nr:tetratricopeptide repeat protein [Anaerolineae bacterium]
MTSATASSLSSLQTAQFRLARHYLNKLRTADAAHRHGQSSIAYGSALFDLEWEQIQHWQAWAAQQRGSDQASAQLCEEFSLAGLEVLSNRRSAADHAVWLKAALESAQQLDDGEGACTLSYELAMIYYRLGTLDEMERLAQQLLKLGEAANDSLSVGRAYLLLGVFADERGRYAEADTFYQRTLELSLEIGSDEVKGRALNGLGAVAFYRGDYEKAHHYLSRQLDLMEATGNKNKICHALIAMGRILIGLRAYDQAEECLLRAVNMCRLLGFRRLLGVGLLNLGSLELQRRQLEAARSHIEEGMDVVRSTNTQRQIIRGLTLLGDTYMRLGYLPKALEQLQEGLSLARDAGLPRHLCDLQYILTNVYLALNDLDAARSALYETLILAEKLDSHPQKMEAVSSAIAYFQRIGFSERATVWAGSLMDDPLLDQSQFNPICLEIEASLGSAAYQRALTQGQMHPMSVILSEILALMTDQ